MSTVNPEIQQQAPPNQPVDQEQDSWVLDNGADDDLDVLQSQPAPAPAPVAPPTSPTPPIPPATQSQPQTFQVRTRTGQVFQGATPQEAADKAQAYFDRLQSDAVRGYEGQQPQHQPQTPTHPAWDDVKFYETFGKNPREAMEMWAKEFFGIDDPASALTRSYDVSIQVSDRIATAEFLNNNQDFPASNESAAILLKRLAADNAEITSWNMEVAYRQLVREGVLAPISAQPGAAPAPNPTEESQRPYDSRGAVAPPSPPDSGAPPIDFSGRRDLTQDEFEQLTTDQMRQYITNRRNFRR